VLIGFMGAGKSAVGLELAARTGLPFHDTDQAIVRAFGMSIGQIFARQGEEQFRARETALLQELEGAPAIIATGGGVVSAAQNVDTLRRRGTLVYLTADEETLWRRTRESDRPLLQTPDPRGTFTELLSARAPLYCAAADLTVSTTKLSIAEVADAVLRALEEVRSYAG